MIISKPITMIDILGYIGMCVLLLVGVFIIYHSLHLSDEISKCIIKNNDNLCSKELCYAKYADNIFGSNYRAYNLCNIIENGVKK